MNAFNMAKTAYSNTSIPIRTTRGTEYNAFARITHQMKAASQVGASFNSLVSALHENGRLWALLAVDVADKDNALPKQLRAQIFYLYEFTTLHSRKVLRKEETIDALLDINTAIMRGLRNQAVVS